MYWLGLFTRLDCDYDFFIATKGSYGIQCTCKYSHGAITTTLNPIQLISCNKQIAVAIPPCEQPLNHNNRVYSLPQFQSVPCQIYQIWQTKAIFSKFKDYFLPYKLWIVDITLQKLLLLLFLKVKRKFPICPLSSGLESCLRRKTRIISTMGNKNRWVLDVKTQFV